MIATYRNVNVFSWWLTSNLLQVRPYNSLKPLLESWQIWDCIIFLVVRGLDWILCNSSLFRRFSPCLATQTYKKSCVILQAPHRSIRTGRQRPTKLEMKYVYYDFLSICYVCISIQQWIIATLVHIDECSLDYAAFNLSLGRVFYGCFFKKNSSSLSFIWRFMDYIYYIYIYLI